MASASVTHLAEPLAQAEGRVSAPMPDPLVPTVFHEPWWLDIVTGGDWAAAEFREDGRVVGRMPYQLTRRFGGPAIGMPQLTHFLGPATVAGPGSAQNRWLKRTAITRELILALPRRARFRQKFHRGITDVVAFQAEQFETAVQFTFEVAPAPETLLWAALRDKHRNVIRKARRSFAVQAIEDGQEFTAFYARALLERGLANWVPPDIMARLLPAAVGRGCGEMLGLRDGHGNLVAAIFCARDHAASYYTLSARTPQSGNGGVTLLIWDAIRRAAQDGLVFDFDGLSTANSIGLYAGFGGCASPRYVSSRSPATAVMRLARRRLGLPSNSFGA